MVDPLVGLLFCLCSSLLLDSIYGHMTPPVPLPSAVEKLVPNLNGEVTYSIKSVFGVVNRAVILDCGSAKQLPDIYIWSFLKPSSQEIKNVVYNLGKGPRMQKFSRTLGQVTVISRSASLSIDRLALAAHGMFLCQAIYETATEARVVYYSVNLTVQVPISKPYLEISKSSPVEGNTIWMRCNLDNGTGPIQYEWHHQNHNGSLTVFGHGNSSVINLTHINRNSTGWYRCRAENPVNSEQSDRSWLDIIFGPDTPQIDVTPYTMTERGYSALERETVSLLCQAQSNPASQYVWLYNNSQVFGGPQYTITKILRMHTGDYTCLAQNTYLNTRSKKSISLTVYFGPDLPQIFMTPNTRTESGYTTIEKYTAIERDNVSLLCQTESNPPSEYLWMYNNSHINSGPKLIISNVLRSEAGYYTCVAQNSLLKTSSTTNISLTVYYPPEDLQTCSVEVVSNHSSLRLLCLWTGGYPPPKLRWGGDLNATQQEETDTNIVKNTAIFVPSEDNTSNNSSFTCTGSHPAVPQPAECSIHTYVPPGELQCIFSLTGLNVTLSCLWEGGVPRALVWWDGPGGHSKPGQEGSNNMILRYGTLGSDRPYSCYARHPLLFQTKICQITMAAVSRPNLLVTEVSPLEGSNISMMCNVNNGTGPIQYEWLYEAENGDSVKVAQSNSSVFLLNTLKHNQTGWYRCGATNLVNSQKSDPVWVDVIYAPANSSFCSMEAVSNHSSLRLLCLWAGGYPTPKMRWSGDLNLTQQEEKDTNMVKNTAIFMPSEDNTSNNSSFTCTGSHPAVPQPAECSIHTYVPPGQLQCIFSLTGLNVILSCLWEGGVPRALVWWDGPGGHSKPGQEGSNNMILRYGTLRSDRSYNCYARHPLLFQTKICQITMAAVSRPNLLVTEVSPLEGSNISMMCNVNNGTGPIQYEWLYEAENGDSLNVAQSNSSVFLLSTLKHNQTGWYRCGATNLVNSQKSDPVWVDIIYAPANSSFCSMEPVSNHSSLRLLCLWAGGYPTPKLSWSGDLNLTQQEEKDTNMVKNTAIFVSSEDNTSNNSSFTCTGSHPAVPQPAECSIHTYVPQGQLQCFFSVTDFYVTLSCLWEGGVPRALVWWDGPGGHNKPGQEGSNNMTLRYGTVRSDRPYSCYARHPLLFQTKVCKITMVPVSKPELAVNDANPKEDSTVSMRCSLKSGTEPIQFLWLYQALNGNTSIFAQNTSEIQLTVKRSDTGWYSCLVKNLVNTIQSDQTLLNVTYGPDFPEIVVTYTVAERGYIALEEEMVSLFCKAKSNPPSQYKWFYNNSQINNNAGPKLTRSRILRNQTGEYTCLAQNKYLNTRSKNSISLTVYYPPDSVPSCSVEGAVEHKYLRLLCTWPGGFPIPNLFWSGDLVNQEGVSRQTNTAILQYLQGTVANNSQFRCQGSHIALNQPTGCYVKPYSPVGEPFCSAYVTSNTQSLMLSCLWDGGNPKALVWWEGPGIQVKSGQETSNILILRYGKVRNERPYICHARHPLVAETKTCTVPLEPPVLRTQRRTVTVFEGTDVQLTCSLMDNNLPSNEITWFNNRGVGIHDTSKYLLLRSSAWANLTVRDTHETQDSGQYRCTASNAVGGTEVNVTLVVKRHPLPPNASLISVVYNSPQRNQVDLEWQVHKEEDYKDGWTGFILEYAWMSEKPGRRGGTNSSTAVQHPGKVASIWYSSIIQDADQRAHTLGSLTPTVTYQFRITSVNHRTLGHPSEPKTPAEPRQNSLPAIIGAAIGGMLFAAILTALLLVFIIRNRNNNPRLHDLLFGRQHSQSRENINFPEDEVMGSAGGIEDIGGSSSSGPTMALPRAASPLTVVPQSATPSTGQPPPLEDGNEPVNVTITVKAT